jgi:transposase
MESAARKNRSRVVRSRPIERCRAGDRTVGQVARDFDLTETAVREWVTQAKREEGSRVDGGVTSKRATAFFARETR